MSGGQVRVVGAATLRRTCAKAAVDITAMQQAHTEASALVARVAAPRTPRRTGRLAASVRSSGTRSAAIVRAGGASVPYAGPIHWGWPRRNIRPQPWLSDTAVDTQPQWLDVYLAGVDQVLKTIKGK